MAVRRCRFAGYPPALAAVKKLHAAGLIQARPWIPPAVTVATLSRSRVRKVDKQNLNPKP